METLVLMAKVIVTAKTQTWQQPSISFVLHMLLATPTRARTYTFTYRRKSHNFNNMTSFLRGRYRRMLDLHLHLESYQ